MISLVFQSFMPSQHVMPMLGVSDHPPSILAHLPGSPSLTRVQGGDAHTLDWDGTTGTIPSSPPLRTPLIILIKCLLSRHLLNKGPKKKEGGRWAENAENGGG